MSENYTQINKGTELLFRIKSADHNSEKNEFANYY